LPRSPGAGRKEEPRHAVELPRHQEAFAMLIPLDAFQDARRRVAPHIHHTPLLASRTLSRQTGFDVRLKAEVFQRTGSYKIRGPLNKLALLSEQERRRGVICSSAGNHAQGVALAAQIYGVRAVVTMAANATPSKVAATRAYGAEVVLHGRIWDEANAKAQEIAARDGLTLVHPFDDPQLIAGQGTLGLEIYADWPEVDIAVVPIGGGGLISGVAMALRHMNPKIRIIGVESSGAPGMQRSVAAGHVVTLERVDSIIDGLRVQRVGEFTLQAVRENVAEIVTLPDEAMFDAMLWIMSYCKLVVEGAAAAPVAALLHGLVRAPRGARVACVLSGGNVNLDQLKGLRWN
jgi:threonine dehydratase